jgi:hypothetical protein
VILARLTLAKNFQIPGMGGGADTKKSAQLPACPGTSLELCFRIRIRLVGGSAIE